MRNRPPSGVPIVIAGIDGDHTGGIQRCRYVDGANVCVGIGRAHHEAVKLAMRVFIIDKIAATGQQFRIFEPGYGLGNTVFAQVGCPPS